MVKRYTFHDLAHLTLVGNESMVMASDYDALAADKADDARRMADDANKLHATYSRIRELEAIVQRFVVFDPYPDSTLTKDARALLAAADRWVEHD